MGHTPVFATAGETCVSRSTARYLKDMTPPLVTFSQRDPIMTPLRVSPVLATVLCDTFPQIDLRLPEELFN